MNENETTDSFRKPEESNQTIITFTAKDPNAKGLRRDDNEELNRLKEELENYIEGLMAGLKSEILSSVNTSIANVLEGTEGKVGLKGDKGDRGATGAAGTTLTAGNGIDITAGVISVDVNDLFDICA